MKGHIFLAQNSDINYVRQAYLLALSIKAHNRSVNNTCLLTNDSIPGEYIHAFDYVVSIPGDLAADSVWKVENRWKIMDLSPFKENIVYDADMLITESNDHWWKFFENRDLVFTSNVFDYRNNVITDDYYRKTFTANILPNLYVGVFYFRKSKLAYEYFKWLEIITKDWKTFYSENLKIKTPKFYSMDVSSAMAIKFMDCEAEVISKKSLIPSFVHMKPAVQRWESFPEKWTTKLSSNLDENGKLKIGNYQQTGIFHYVEDEFIKEDMFYKLEKLYENSRNSLR